MLSRVTSDTGPPEVPSVGKKIRYTLIGGIALLMWATLPLFTTMTGQVPPFLLVALTFAIAAVFSAASTWIRSGRPARMDWPWSAWLVGVGGLFGYHFLYFLALRSAPPADASLINHLWPLLIVVFSALLPGERLRIWHVAGALLGLTGTVLLVTRGGTVRFAAEYTLGYLAALGCAVTWASYSLLSRRFAHVPTEAVGSFCAVTAVLAALCHSAFEPTVWPVGGEWFIVLLLGLGPVGAAFFAWDVGMKRGDVRVLGASAYLIPLLSTALLIGFGRAEPSGTLLLACVLITTGAALAARDMLIGRRA